MAVSSLREALAPAYESAVYTAELPAGRVEFRIGRAPEGPVPEVPLAIITAWNPGSRRTRRAANCRANQRLAKALQAGGWSIHPAGGRSEDGVHEEPSFAVVGIMPDAVLALARVFGQAAVFYWDGTRARLLWC